MDYLPREVLSYILMRLPVASLLRLCCVSKKFYALITSPYFVDEHFRYSQNNGGRRVLLLERRRRPLYSESNLKAQIFPLDEDQSPRVVAHDLKLPFPSASDVRFFGSCNGIVCMSDSSSAYLCNPATRRFLTLPSFGFASRYAVTRGMGLGFDKETQNYQVIRLALFLGVLKLDPSSIHHDFEVTSLLTDKPSAETLAQGSSTGILGQGWPTIGAEIYNLNTNSWRKLDVVLPHIDEKKSAAVLNGRYFHWCTKYPRILSFDMNTHSFRQMEIPGKIPHLAGLFTPTWNVGVVDSSLAFMFLFQMQIDVWVMKEYGMQESWMRKYSIGAVILASGIASLTSWNDKLFMVSADEQELMSCSVHYYGNIRKYGGNSRGGNYSLAYSVYEESLVSLYRGRLGLPWRMM